MTLPEAPPVEWIISAEPVDYPQAVQAMEARVEDILAGRAGEAIWLLQHPPLYTAGPSAKAADLLEGARLPVFPSGRGGQYTYHGPGQRVVYVMLDLRRRRPDVRAYIRILEEWIIRALADFGVIGLRRAGRTGVWVARGGGREDKIAAIGVRLRRWVGFHGFAVNLDPDLAHFAGIVPCGIANADFGVTSLADLRVAVTMAQLDAALARHFTRLFQTPILLRNI